MINHLGGCVDIGSEGINWRAGLTAMMVSVSQGLIDMYQSIEYPHTFDVVDNA